MYWYFIRLLDMPDIEVTHHPIPQSGIAIYWSNLSCKSPQNGPVKYYVVNYCVFDGKQCSDTGEIITD